ncbi:hypothetical protein TWF506_007852 [Arthrobotrys conoides]|uniref:ribonuclease H n=1 Tax=Arthrobotrys conoides TaxID=74498 RepID=A0AAN8RNI1_9PEZI
MPGSASKNRLFTNCPTINNLNLEDQITACPTCKQYCAKCCQHPKGTCHHHRLFFADGSCLNNGDGGARAGVGVAGSAENEDLQISKPFSDLVLGGGNTKRTSQIAELRAAIEAVAMISRFYDEYGPDEEETPKPKLDYRKRKHQKISQDPEEPPFCVIAMDSQYVVKGMTDWLPKWKANGFKNAKGNEPANLSLFLTLEQDICRVEKKWVGGVVICFWWIPREYNKIADGLAQNAAKLDTGDMDPIFC